MFIKILFLFSLLWAVFFCVSAWRIPADKPSRRSSVGILLGTFLSLAALYELWVIM
ncbi:hypothetical protein [Spirosoma pomorum]